MVYKLQPAPLVRYFSTIILRKLSTTLAISLLGISFVTPTHAALITKDVAAGSGDALLTYDSDTGLEWLDTTIRIGDRPRFPADESESVVHGSSPFIR